MAKSTINTLLMSVILLLGVVACGPSLVIQGVDYAQPIESVLTPDGNNQVHDQRYAIKFNLSPILTEEEVNSVSEVRLIRSNAGYYFVTAADFSNVYVFETAESELKLKTKIEITNQGLGQPAFNQRNNVIQLVDLMSGTTYNLDHNGRR